MSRQLSRWNPLKEMEEFQKRLNSPWGWDPLSILGKETLTSNEWSPNVDIIEDDHEFLVKAELPDIKREEVTVTVDNGMLTISGERRREKEEKNKRYHRIESDYGSFVRTFNLPSATVSEKVTAEFKDGILRIHLPKDVKAISAKTIEIKAS